MYLIITSSQQAGHLLGARCIVSSSLRRSPKLRSEVQETSSARRGNRAPSGRIAEERQSPGID